ncbi:MAG: YraN family protein [Acidobacteriota bacterium]
MLLTLLDTLRHRARHKSWAPDQASSRRGEDLAHRFLRGRGYVIVARNYRLAAGDAEADLIAWDQDELVIVEVKTRASAEHGPPERAISPEKQQALSRIAREYCSKINIPPESVRCDLVTVLLTTPPGIELFQQAVRLTGIA